MVRVRRSTVIDAPLVAVWEVLRDFNGHHRWHPAVAQSELEADRQTDQIGAVRRFRLSSGELVRERLLTLSDRDHSFSYTIVESDVPLRNYVAEVSLKPVTDGNRTFWSWRCSFNTPPGQEKALAGLVAEQVYEAGFKAIRAILESPAKHSVAQSNSGQTGATSSRLADGALSGDAMVVERYGGPEVFRLSQVQVPRPGPGQVRIRQHAIGVNYIDVYCRTGYFKLLQAPAVPGMEAAGEVVDVGSGVRHLQPGQRVAYACPPVGAYASARTVDASLVVPLPDSIDAITAAGALLKGMTAEFLLHRVHPLQAGETVLVFAPAGGVGNLLCQWASHLGATVIAATSSEKKAKIARDAGAGHVILPGPKSLEEQIRDITDGRGVEVIYDAVGRDTFRHSLAALAECGHLVSYGQASGDIGDWNISSLAAKSTTLSRPNFAHYTDTPEKVKSITERLFEAIERRILKINVNHRFPLEEAAEAHRLLEGRQSTGSVVLIPERVIHPGSVPSTPGGEG